MKNRSLAHKTAWSAAASICNLCGRLAVQITLARTLGPEGVGRLAYIVWLIEVSNLLVCLGLPNSLTRYLAELHGHHQAEEAGRFARWVYLRYLLLALVGAMAVGLFFLRSPESGGIESALPLLMLLFVARGLESINHADLAGRQRFDLLARVNVASALSLVAGVAVGATLYGVPGALAGYLVGALIPAAYSFTILKGYTLGQAPDAELRRRVWKFALNTWLAMVVSAFVWTRIEVFFLTRYWNAVEVAMFTVALTFADLVRQVAAMFSGAFMPHFSHLLGNGHRDLVQRQYATATRLMALLIVPAAFGGSALMPVLVPWMFGEQFAAAVPNAMVLTVTASLAFSQIGSSLVYAKERSGFIAFSGIAGAALSIACGVFVISAFGAWGAVWCRLGVQSIMIALGTWFIVARLHFAYPFRAIGGTALAAAASAFCAWIVIRWLPTPAVGVPLAVLVGALIYVACLRWLQVLGSEEVRQIQRTFARLPARWQKPLQRALEVIAPAP